MEKETLEGDFLTRLLESEPKEPWPPEDLQPKDPGPESSNEDGNSTSSPSSAPVVKPGLAWEGGSTNTSVN
jgi:hypothetical protein